jgi:hypothetical protein
MTDELLGVWWREGSDKRVGGQLLFQDGGPKLVLFGSFFDWSDYDLTKGLGFPLGAPQKAAIVHGRTLEPVSILDARCQSPILPGTEGFERWHAQAVVWAHVTTDSNDAQPTFGGVRFELETLPAWARARGIERTLWLNGSRTEAAAQPHELAEATLASGERVSIRQHAVTSEGPRQLEIRQPVSIAIEDTAPATWVELLNQWLQPLQVLLWVSTTVPGRVQKMELFVDGDGAPSRWAKLRASLVEPVPRGDRELHASEVLFHADDLPGGFGEGLARWFTLWEDLRHVLGPLYARASAPFGYANDRFYVAAAAIEAYHRYCVTSDRDLPATEHRQRVERVQRVMAERAPDLEEWATNAVRPFNRIPLWRRISALGETLPELSADLFGDHLEDFAKAVEGARHGHAHALQGDRPIDSGKGLYLAADALLWVMRACWMIDLGLGLDESQARVRRHEGFRRTRSQLADVLSRTRLRDKDPRSGRNH